MSAWVVVDLPVINYSAFSPGRRPDSTEVSIRRCWKAKRRPVRISECPTRPAAFVAAGCTAMRRSIHQPIRFLDRATLDPFLGTSVSCKPVPLTGAGHHHLGTETRPANLPRSHPPGTPSLVGECHQSETPIGVAHVDPKIRLTTCRNCSRAVRPVRAWARRSPCTRASSTGAMTSL
jgi:hypothetical protein